MGRYYKVRTNRMFFVARGTAFFSRLPIGRINRAVALDYIKQGKLKPWRYTKEQVLGAPVSMSFDYNPRPVRLIGTVMDAHCEETNLKGGIKVFSKSDETNMSLWVPAGNPKLKVELTAARGSFDHYLAERDRWDEAWATGRARIK